MLRKSTILAVAATAALGFSMLSSSANAMGARGFGGGGFHGGGFHGGGMGARFAGGSFRGRPQFHPGWHSHPHWHAHYWRRPIWYGYGVQTVDYAPRPVAGPCTCLSKEYTPEGAVLFKDRCTNEMAMNPPPAPQQTGALEPQQQPAYSQQYVQPTPSNAQPVK